MTALLLTLLLACGQERWAEKTLADREAILLSLAPHPTTIAAFTALPRHDVRPSTPRILGLETTLWDVQATVCLVKHEKDGDLHVVLADTPEGCTAGPTVIAESPAPECDGLSLYRTIMRAARVAVEQWKVGDEVHIQAAGFQDFDHGQTGRAPNEAELHPVLWVLP